MITGFNPTDMYAAHVRRVLQAFPASFQGLASSRFIEADGARSILSGLSVNSDSYWPGSTLHTMKTEQLNVRSDGVASRVEQRIGDLRQDEAGAARSKLR